MKVPPQIPTVQQAVVALMQAVLPELTRREAYYKAMGIDKKIPFNSTKLKLAIGFVNLQDPQVMADEFIARTVESWTTIRARNIEFLLHNINYFFAKVKGSKVEMEDDDEENEDEEEMDAARPASKETTVFKGKYIERAQAFFLEQGPIMDPSTGAIVMGFLTNFDALFQAMDNIIKAGLIMVFYARDPERRADGAIVFKNAEMYGQVDLALMGGPKMFDIHHLFNAFTG